MSDCSCAALSCLLESNCVEQILGMCVVHLQFIFRGKRPQNTSVQFFEVSVVSILLVEYCGYFRIDTNFAVR